MKGKSKFSVLSFSFTSECCAAEVDCFFCGASFAVLPVVVEMSAFYNGDAGGFDMCPACVLSDPATLAAKARATALEHSNRAKAIKRKRKCDRTEEDAEFLELGNNSKDLIEYVKALGQLRDASEIRHHELAAVIAREYLRYRRVPGKAA